MRVDDKLKKEVPNQGVSQPKPQSAAAMSKYRDALGNPIGVPPKYNDPRREVVAPPKSAQRVPPRPPRDPLEKALELQKQVAEARLKEMAPIVTRGDKEEAILAARRSADREAKDKAEWDASQIDNVGNNVLGNPRDMVRGIVSGPYNTVRNYFSPPEETDETRAADEVQLQERFQRRQAFEKASPELQQIAKDVVYNITDREQARKRWRSLSPQMQEALVPILDGAAQVLGDAENRDSAPYALIKGLNQGARETFQHPIERILGIDSKDQREEQFLQQASAVRDKEAGVIQPQDPMAWQGAAGATKQAPFMAVTAGAAGAGRWTFSKIAGALFARNQAVPQTAKQIAAMGAAARAGELTGTALASLAPMYDGEVQNLKAAGMTDGPVLHSLAAVSGLVGGLLEGIIPNPWSIPGVKLRRGVLNQTRQFTEGAIKNYGAQLNEEGWQAFSSSLGTNIAQYLDENVKESGLGDAFKSYWGGVSEAALPMLFSVGAPATVRAAASAPRSAIETAKIKKIAAGLTPEQAAENTARWGQLLKIREKKFVSENEAKEFKIGKPGKAGKNRKGRMADLDAEIERLEDIEYWRAKSEVESQPSDSAPEFDTGDIEEEVVDPAADPASVPSDNTGDLPANANENQQTASPWSPTQIDWAKSVLQGGSNDAKDIDLANQILNAAVPAVPPISQPPVQEQQPTPQGVPDEVRQQQDDQQASGQAAPLVAEAQGQQADQEVRVPTQEEVADEKEIKNQLQQSEVKVDAGRPPLPAIGEPVQFGETEFTRADAIDDEGGARHELFTADGKGAVQTTGADGVVTTAVHPTLESAQNAFSAIPAVQARVRAPEAIATPIVAPQAIPKAADAKAAEAQPKPQAPPVSEDSGKAQQAPPAAAPPTPATPAPAVQPSPTAAPDVAAPAAESQPYEPTEDEIETKRKTLFSHPANPNDNKRYQAQRDKARSHLVGEKHVVDSVSDIEKEMLAGQFKDGDTVAMVGNLSGAFTAGDGRLVNQDGRTIAGGSIGQKAWEMYTSTLGVSGVPSNITQKFLDNLWKPKGGTQVVRIGKMQNGDFVENTEATARVRASLEQAFRLSQGKPIAEAKKPTTVPAPAANTPPVVTPVAQAPQAPAPPQNKPKTPAVVTPTQTDKQSAEFPVASGVVDGRTVRTGSVPNMGSIDAELSGTEYEVLPGIREVPMSAFPGLTGKHYSVQGDKKIGKLQEAIAQSNEITPLIVVVDDDGPYILEGATRSDALFNLGAKSFPAVVVDARSRKEALEAKAPVAEVAPPAIESAPVAEPLAEKPAPKQEKKAEPEAKPEPTSKAKPVEKAEQGEKSAEAAWFDGSSVKDLQEMASANDIELSKEATDIDTIVKELLENNIVKGIVQEALKAEAVKKAKRKAKPKKPTKSKPKPKPQKRPKPAPANYVPPPLGDATVVPAESASEKKQEEILAAMGVDLRIVEGGNYEIPAWFDPTTMTIWINRSYLSQWTNAEEMAWGLFAHEAFHAMRRSNREVWNKVYEWVKEREPEELIKAGEKYLSLFDGNLRRSVERDIAVAQAAADKAAGKKTKPVVRVREDMSGQELLDAARAAKTEIAFSEYTLGTEEYIVSVKSNKGTMADESLSQYLEDRAGKFSFWNELGQSEPTLLAKIGRWLARVLRFATDPDTLAGQVRLAIESAMAENGIAQVDGSGRRAAAGRSEVEIDRLRDHLLTQNKTGPFDPKHGENWHKTLVRFTRNIGEDELADALEMNRPTQEEIEFGSRPLSGALPGSKKRQEFSAMYRAYNDVVDQIADVAFEEDSGRAAVGKQNERKSLTLDEVRSRVAKDYALTVSSEPMRMINGQPFSSLDPDAVGTGLLIQDADASMRRMMAESLQEAGVPEEIASTVKVPSSAEVDYAFRLTNGSRYWYELSAMGFIKDFFNLSRKLTEHLIDIVAGTSGGQKPTDNLRVAVASMSQDMQGRPVSVGTRDESSLTAALSPAALETHKFGNFSDTMQVLGGLRPGVKPLPTIDLQMAKVFGVLHAAIASNPRMYEAMSRFLIKLRDAQNAMLKDGEQPYESWQIQALLWVAQRDTSDPDSYNIGMPKIVAQLKKAGIPTPGGKITEETLMDPRTSEVLAPTSKIIPEAYTATIGTRTNLTKVGRESAEVFEKLKTIDAPWAKRLVEEFEKIQRRTMRAIGNRRPPKPGNKTRQKSVASWLLSVIMNKSPNSHELSRVDTDAWGTFEGDASPNIRFPLNLGAVGDTEEGGGTKRYVPTKAHREQFLSVLGKHLKQESQAASQFIPADLGSHDTFSILVRRYDKVGITEAELAEISAGLGRPISYKQVPNGWQLDINIRGFDKTEEQKAENRDLARLKSVMQKLEQSTGKLYNWHELPQSYDFSYIDKSGYNKHIRNLENAISRNTDTGGSGKGVGYTTDGGASDYAAVVEQIKDIAAKQESAFRKWTKDAKELAAKREIQFGNQQRADSGRAAVGQRPEPAGDRGGRSPGRKITPLAGSPSVPGINGPDPEIVAVAERYAAENGIDLKRQAEYVQVDEKRAKRIANAYEKMAHAPQDPKVKEAYQDLIKQTVAQYKALADAGYKFWFTDLNIPSNVEYLSSPYNSLRDLRNNKQMGVFPTSDGFGTSDLDVNDNPLLADTGFMWPSGGLDGELKPVLANDLFRAVHDAFGHSLEGAGFRARGEENAWQAHVRLFTGPAVGAITSETRGQNSWLNFGPHGEKNRNAKVEDTTFADQKTGLMPGWTWTEGRAADYSETANEENDNDTTEENRPQEPRGRAAAGRSGKESTSAVRRRAGLDGKVWRKSRDSRTLDLDGVVARYTAEAPEWADGGVATPGFVELQKSEASAKKFTAAINAARESQGTLGASVYVYPEQDYRDMRVFLTEDGKAGFALKDAGDGIVDVVSVFNTKGSHKSVSYSLMRLAVEAGGNTLNAFDTFLPELYSANGFRVIARAKWNDEYSPGGWDKKEYEAFNNGEPDVVFMAYDPQRTDIYRHGSGEGQAFDDIDEAVKLQRSAATEYGRAAVGRQSAAEAFDPDQIKKEAKPGYKSQEKLVEIKIDDFLSLAEDGFSADKAELVRDIRDRGDKFSSLPYLTISKNRVAGHEGRHRARQLKAEGFTTMPVVLRTLGLRWSEQSDPKKDLDYIKNWPTELRAQAGAENEDFTVPFPVAREDAMTPYTENPGARAAVGRQTDTAAFKKWFGDSKVVDADGKPLVVYHGTSNMGFTVFDPERRGENTNAGNTVIGDFFTDDIGIADNGYATKNGGIMEVYLAIQKPRILRDKTGFDNDPGTELRKDAADYLGKQPETPEDWIEYRDYLIRSGYDGIEFSSETGDLVDWKNPKEGRYDQVTYVTFDPTQIKSATGNQGTFDPGNPDIRYSAGRQTPADKIAWLRKQLEERKAKPPVEKLPETTGTKHAKTDELRAKRGLPPRALPTPETFQEWEDEALRKYPNAAARLRVVALAERHPNRISKIENAAIGQHIVDLENRREAGEDVLDELLRTVKASAVGGTEAGRDLVSRKVERYSDYSLAGLIKQHLDSVGKDPTDKQMAEYVRLAEENKKLKEENQKLEKKLTQEAIARRKAEAEAKPKPVQEKQGTKRATLLKKVAAGFAAFQNAWGGGTSGRAAASRQKSQTDTPAFKKWFGDSKVVDADGKPLVVYHGTNNATAKDAGRGFTAFDPATMGRRDAGYFGKGFYFSPNPVAAEMYAGYEPGARIMPVYISIQNPYIYERDDRVGLPTIELLREQGYDGIFVMKTRDGKSRMAEIVAFDPTQIKSATGNQGTFDPSNPDIRYAASQQDPSDPKKIAADIISALREAGVSSILELDSQVKANIPNVTPEQMQVFRDAWDESVKKTKVASPLGAKPDQTDISARAKELMTLAIQAGYGATKETWMEVVDVVHAQLSTEIPGGITVSDTMQAMSDYGVWRPLNKEEVATKTRAIRGKTRQSLKIEDALNAIEKSKEWLAAGISPEEVARRLREKNLLPKATGREQATPDSIERDLIAEFNRLKKELPVPVKSQEGKLKSALATAKTAGKNRLELLDKEIKALKEAVANKVRLAKPVSSPTPQQTDPELIDIREKLAKKRKERAAAKAEYDAIFPPTKQQRLLTEEQRLAMAERMLASHIEAVKEEVRSLEDGTWSPATKGVSPTSDAKKALEAELADLKATLERARKANPEYQARKEARYWKQYRKSQERRLVFWERRLAEAEAGRLPVSLKKRTITEQDVLENNIKIEHVQYEAMHAIEKAKRATWNTGQWIGYGLLEATSLIPKTLMLGLDLSFVSRQGFFYSRSQPIKAFMAAVEAIPAVFSQRLALASMESIESRPNAGEYHLAEVDFTQSHGPKAKLEEMYQSAVVQWLTTTKLKSLLPFRLLAAAYSSLERGNRTFSNIMKADLYDIQKRDTLAAREFFNMLEDKTGGRIGGASVEWTENDIKQAGRTANIFSGRGTGLKGGSPWLDFFFLARRWAWSRIQADLVVPFQLMTPQMIGQWNADRGMRVALAKLYIQTLMGHATKMAIGYWVYTLLAGDDEDKEPTIEWDPRSTDAWVMKMGETRLKDEGGLMPIFVLASRLLTGTTKTSAGEIKSIYGEDVPWGGKDGADLLISYARYKLGTGPSAILEWASGRDAIGKPMTKADMIASRITPLGPREIAAAEKELGVTQGTLVALETFFGASVSTYGDRTTYKNSTEAERKELVAKDLENVKWDSPDPGYKEFLSPQEIKAFQAEREQRQQGLIERALVVPKREPGQTDESYNKELARQAKAFQEVQEAGWTPVEIRQLFLKGKKRSERGGVYDYSPEVKAKLRMIPRRFGDQ